MALPANIASEGVQAPGGASLLEPDDADQAGQAGEEARS